MTTKFKKIVKKAISALTKELRTNNICQTCDTIVPIEKLKKKKLRNKVVLICKDCLKDL